MPLSMIREIKVSSDWFGCVLVISFWSRKCSRNRSPVVFLFHQCTTFCNKRKLCSWCLTLTEVRVKRSAIFMVVLGPKVFSTLWMKGQVLHRKRAYLKVPNKLIKSQHYKRWRRIIMIAFHLLRHFTFTTTQLNPIFLKTLYYLIQDDSETVTIFS